MSFRSIVFVISTPGLGLDLSSDKNMENRVAKHLRLEINIVCVCAYCDLHLPAGPASQVILRGFEDVKNVQKTSTY